MTAFCGTAVPRGASRIGNQKEGRGVEKRGQRVVQEAAIRRGHRQVQRGHRRGAEQSQLAVEPIGRVT